ncbi:hypothetical protein FJT64_021466 [Amphibalanus amphitrite]|uniref:Uncharacterized protein n=1 Tax=Amphibalanus amphitrite TaxID=1232801 RepID=A0A6A4WXK1_AMPAM|nr:hypothetical protein FJT64_021466 [Amphibalanus amphitrite]KAF0307142.1 hypothetical protein FJT64_021466 [Amphibalanus amphitrite]
MSLHGGTQMDSKQAARAVIFERKLLILCLWLAAMSLLTWIVSISTNYWYVTHCIGADEEEHPGLPDVSRAALLSAHGGLWKSCKTVLDNDTNLPGQAFVITACRNHKVFSVPELPADHPINVLIGFWRTSLAFSVLSVLMQLLTIFFSWYSMRVPRYTFKRPHRLSVLHLRYSFIMALVCFITNIVCAVCVFYTSGKKKKVHPLMATLHHDHEHMGDDEPVIFSGR